MATLTAGPADAGAPALDWQRRRSLLLGLTAAAGWLDALAWIGLGKLFISFMSGNLLFLGLGAGTGDTDLTARAAIVVAAFLAGTAIGALLTGSRLAPAAFGATMTRALVLEGAVLVVFAVVWIASGSATPDSTTAVALLAIGAVAMGLQAAVALAFHLPNVATVALTATLAQAGALLGWRLREGPSVTGTAPAFGLMVMLCLAYVVAAIVVAAGPHAPAMAIGPVVLLAIGAIGDASTRSADR